MGNEGRRMGRVLWTKKKTNGEALMMLSGGSKMLEET
jgi:hypothetical protein